MPLVQRRQLILLVVASKISLLRNNSTRNAFRAYRYHSYCDSGTTTMTQPKIGSIGPILKKIYLAIKGYKRVFSRVEKIIITVLVFSAVTTLVFWVKEVRSQGDNYGVIYSEGWLSNGQAPSNQLRRLTYAGLTRYMKDGTVGADIAEKWEESEDHLTYTFYLRPDFAASAVLQNIEQNKELFGDASVSAEKTTPLFLS